MKHLLVWPLLSELCSLDDLAVYNPCARRSTVKKTETEYMRKTNVMVDDIEPHITDIWKYLEIKGLRTNSLYLK